ncbi:MAG: hypothetical protein LBU16_03315 [Treponema sp.]|jgi:hypothetical protein|nr:hypothetical protein [Treponema sp.]
MAKISTNERLRYGERVAGYRQAVDELLKKEKETLSHIRAEKEDSSMIQIALAEDMLNLASNYIILSGVSNAVVGVRNEEALNDARKSLYKCVIYLEGVLGNYVDAPFSDYEDKLARIAPLDAAGRYLLVRKLGLAIQLLKDAYGDHSKWKWSFVELEGRFAAAAKNIMDLKKASANTDPRSPEYEPTVYLLRLIKKLLSQAADRYRERYELSTKSIEDLKMGIRFLSALRRIQSLVGNRNEVEVTKKKMDVWESKLFADSKKNRESTLKKIRDDQSGRQEPDEDEEEFEFE